MALTKGKKLGRLILMWNKYNSKLVKIEDKIRKIDEDMVPRRHY